MLSKTLFNELLVIFNFCLLLSFVWNLGLNRTYFFLYGSIHLEVLLFGYIILLKLLIDENN